MATILEEEVRIEEEVPVLPKGMSVFMAIPEGFENHEQYRLYLTWRGEIQILSSQIVEIERSSSKEERKKWARNLKETVTSLNRRAKTYPPQKLPTDLKVMCFKESGWENPAHDVKLQTEMVFCNFTKLLHKIHNLTTSVIGVDTLKEIENIKDTRCFSEELAKVFG
jgi:hypothetical protein